MPYCTRKFEFDAGHRVVDHKSKCKFLHGHRYCAEATVYADELDEMGMVADFGDLKTILGDWINTNVDHNMLLYEKDPILMLFPDLVHTIVGRPPYVLPFNPTAENLVQWMFGMFQELLGPYVYSMVHLRLFETPNCWSDYHAPFFHKPLGS